MQNEQQQSPSWGQVAGSEKFKALAPEQQERARELYYQDNVAPRVPKGMEQRARAMFDQDTLGAIEQEKPQPQPQQDGIQAMDFVKEAGGGALTGTGSMVSGLGDFIRHDPQDRMPVETPNGDFMPLSARIGSLVDPITGAIADAIDGPARAAGGWISGKGKSISDSKTGAAKQALQASTPAGDIDSPSTWSMGEDPSIAGYGLHAANLVGQFAPQAAAMVATKGRSIQTPAMMGIGGLQAGGAAGDEVEDRITATADAELQQSSTLYKKLRQTMPEKDARQSLIETARNAAFDGAAPVGALGGLATQVALGPLQRSIGGSAGRRLAGSILLDAPLEGAQEVAETTEARRATNREIGENRSLTEDTFGDFALGALGGAGHSVAGTALSGAESQYKKTQSDAELNAAIEEAFNNGTLTPEALSAPGLQGLLPAPEQVFYADSEGTVQDIGPVRSVDGVMQPARQDRKWVNEGPTQEQVMPGGPGMDQQTPLGEPAPLTGQFQQGSTQQVEQPSTRPGLMLEGELERPALPAPDAIVVDSQGNAQRGSTAPQVFDGSQGGGRGMDQQAPTAKRNNDQYETITKNNGEPYQTANAAKASKAFRDAKKAGRNPTTKQVDGGFVIQVGKDPKRSQMRPTSSEEFYKRAGQSDIAEQPAQQEQAPKQQQAVKTPEQQAEYSWGTMNTFERNKAVVDSLGYDASQADSIANKAWSDLSDADRQTLSDGMASAPAQRWDAPNQKISDRDRPVLQNRDRSTDASIAQMQGIKTNPGYNRLSVSRDFGNGSPVVEPGAEFPGAQLGKKGTATTSTGRDIPIQYAVIESDQLLASNDALGNTNKNYKAGVEGKSRAVAGNGRVAGLQAAWKANMTAKYKQAMIEDAEHGIDAETIKAMKQPILVRIMPLEEVTSNIGDESNVSGQAGLSAIEQASTDMRRLDLTSLELTADNELSEATVMGFIKGMPTSELGTLLTKSGRPTQAAYSRAETALFQQAYQSEALTENLVDLKGDAKFIMNALMRAAPAMAKLDGAGMYDIRPLVSEAAAIAVNARRTGTPLREYIKTDQIDNNPMVTPILEMMVESGNKTTAIGDKLISLAQLAYAEANKSGQDMFGEVQKLSPRELMRTAFNGEQINDQQDTGSPESLGNKGRPKPDDKPIERNPNVRAGQADGGAVQTEKQGNGRTENSKQDQRFQVEADLGSNSVRVYGDVDAIRQQLRANGVNFPGAEIEGGLSFGIKVEQRIRDALNQQGATDELTSQADDTPIDDEPKNATNEQPVKKEATPEKWRANYLLAAKLARSMGIDPKQHGKLPGLVKAIDAATAEQDAGPAIELEQQTEESRAEAERADKARLEEEKKAQAKQARAESKTKENANDKQAIESSMDRFELGQSAEQQLSGQEDIFGSQQDATPAKESAETKPTEKKGVQKETAADKNFNFTAVVRNADGEPFHVNTRRGGRANVAPFVNGKPEIHSGNPSVDLTEYTFDNEFWKERKIVKDEKTSAKKGIVGAIENVIDEQRAVAKDWESRDYKKNSARVKLGGDGPSNADEMSIGSINESRRKKVIESANHAVRAAEKLKAKVIKQGEQKTLDDLSAIYDKAESGIGLPDPDPKSKTGKLTQDQFFEQQFLRSIGFDGDKAIGATVSNSLSKGVLASVKKHRESQLTETGANALADERPLDQIVDEFFGETKPEAIEDFGEKMKGAIKDQPVSSLSKDLTNEEIASQPLGKLWPIKEMEAIEDPYAAALSYVARSLIPAKPRVAHRLTRWVEAVKLFRTIAKEVNNGRMPLERLKTVGVEKYSLKGVAEKVELLMQLDRKDWGRVGEIYDYSKAYLYDDEGNQQPSPHMSVSIDGVIRKVDGATTIEDTFAEVKKAIAKEQQAAPESDPRQFEIRTVRSTGEIFINRKGDKEYRELKSFKKGEIAAARDFVKNNTDELAAAWEAVKDRDNVSKTDVRSDTNAERSGKDYRNGKDVTSEEFGETFGFRGVEFGNWVSQGKGQADRQGMLNAAYDALLDLAAVVGVPPKAISLNGSLGIAFGSRGKGRYSAHYETDNIVINLTKTKGAGSLAHEWFHALDNYFSRRRGVTPFDGNNSAYNKANYITYKPEPMMALKSSVGKRGLRPYLITKAEHDRRVESGANFDAADWTPDTSHPAGVRPEVEKAFAALVNELDKSPMLGRAEKIDKGKVDGYWSSIIERAARSFESYVIAKMEQQDISNDYLANVVQLKSFKRDEGRYPYLKPQELVPVAEKFDALFSTIETRETDSGVEMYSLKKSGSQKTTSNVKAEEITKAIAESPELAGVKVVQSYDDLPRSVRDRAKRDGVDPGDLRGIYSGGSTYVVADNHANVAEAVYTAVHEEVGHRGIRDMLGGKLTPTMERIYSSYAATAKGRKLIKDIREDYASMLEGMDAAKQRQVIAEELVAYAVQDGKRPTVIQRYISKVRELLRALFPQVSWTNTDILALGEQSRQWLRNSKDGTTNGDAMYSARNSKASQTKTPAFKKWFGDSKVVDANGKPLVVYHGSSADITQFEVNRKQGFRGAYFTKDASLAGMFAKYQGGEQGEANSSEGGAGALYPVYLAIKKPLIINGTAISPGMKGTKLYQLGKKFFPKTFGQIEFESKMNSDRNSSFLTEDAIAELERRGYDGIVNEIDNEIVVFRPEQVKSATGNTGDFDGTNPDIRYSVRRDGNQDAAEIELPEETRFRKAQRIWQDKLNRFTVLREWLEDRGVNLDEDANVYLAEERMHSKFSNKATDFREKTVKPLVEKIQKAGHTMEEVAQYLHAQHAQERNAQIAKINKQMPDGGSGMTNAEARSILAAASKELGALAQEVRAITDSTRKVLLDSGLISKDQANAWQKAYKNYVPLKGGPEDKAAQGGTGKGLKANHKSKRALGHQVREEGEWIVENILADHERALMTAEKNEVGKHLLKMAMDVGIDEIMTVGKPEKRGVLFDQTSYEVLYKGRPIGAFNSFEGARVFKKSAPLTIGKNALASDVTIRKTSDPSVVYMASPVPSPNEAMVYVDGDIIRVQINDDRLAQAYGSMGDDALGTLLRAGQSLNRWLSNVYTGYAPEFLITNVARDFTTGLANITGEEGVAFAAKSVKNYFKSFGELLTYARTGKASKWVTMYREDGGNTGAAYLSDLERLGADMQTEYAIYQGVTENIRKGEFKRAGRAAMRKAFNATLRHLEALNEAGENSMRLALYRTAVEQGMTRNKAASMAKNTTVNFNRRGEMGAQANALYLFFNASVQGTASIAHAHFKGKHKKQAMALSGSMAALGYSLAMLSAGMDEDDYEKTPDHAKDRNLVIPLGDGEAMTIPVPYGYGFFFSFGRLMADAQRGRNIDNTAWKLASSFTGEFMPFGGTTEGDEPDLLQTGLFMLPTLAQIPMSVAVNRTSFGGPMRPDNPFKRYEPDRLKMWRGTEGTWADELAGALEGVGADVSPETLKYLSRTFTGGSGNFVTSTVDAALLGAQGATPEVKEIPLLRKFYRQNSVSDARARFWRYQGETRKATEGFQRIMDEEDGPGARKFAQENRDLLAMGEVASAFSEVASASRDRVQQIRLSDLPVAAKRDQIKKIEDTEAELYDRFVKRFKDRVK